MRYLTPLPYALLPVFVALLSLPGCSKEPTEQQKQADSARTRARVALARGDFRDARSLLDRAVELDQSLGRTALVADELRMFGTLNRDSGAFDSALIFYNRAIGQYRNVADRGSVREVTLDIVSLYRMVGEDRRAFDLSIEALRLARVFQDAAGARDIEWALIPLCRDLSETDEEKEIVSDLLQGAVAAQDLRDQARVSLETGLSSVAAGSYDSAAVRLHRASSLADAARDSLLSMTALLRLAMAEDAAGRLKESFQTYSNAIRRSEKVRGAQPIRIELFSRVGNVYLRMHKPGEAVRFYRAALTAAMNAGNRVAEGTVALQLGTCDLESNRDAAVKEFRSALELFKSLGYNRGTAYAEFCLGVASQRAGQFTEAFKHLKASLDLYDALVDRRSADNLENECERSFLGPGRSAAYEAMIELLMQVGKNDDAFGVIERRVTVMARDELDAFEPRPADQDLVGALTRYFDERARQLGTERLLERLLSGGAQQKEQLAIVRSALEAGTRRLADAAEAVVRQNRAYEPVVRPNGITLSAVQKSLAPGVALIEYVTTRRSFYAFVLSSGTVAVRMAAVSADSIASQSRQYLSLLRRQELHSDTTQFRMSQVEQRVQALRGSLSGAFIRPVESDIATASKLIVVCAGDFPIPPIQTLRQGILPGSPLVAEHHLITYLPWAQALMLTSVPLVSVHDVVGVGHPGGTDWDVEYELRDIRAFYKDAILFFGPQASLATLQEGKGDLLHIAAEFRYYARTPWISSVTLADGQTLTGTRRVHIGELFSISPFPTVVLSDLALDRIAINSAGVYVFLANRTGAVITNAYTPSRKAKKIFGETFYTALLQGNNTPAAYWKTQLEMMKKPESAGQSSWGAFYLWGK